MNARITVMQRAFNKELIDEHFPEYAKTATPCPVFKGGQVFEIKGIFPAKPDAFCDWAWADIQRNVAMACMGADMPAGCAFTCCSDGLRPVTFRIEAVEAS